MDDREPKILAWARWLAFVPALWLSSFTHAGVVKAFGINQQLIAAAPPPAFVTKAEALFALAEVVTVLAALLFAILLGPRRSPLSQVVAVSLVVVALCTYNLMVSVQAFIDLPALHSAVVADNRAGLATALIALLIALSSRRSRTSRSQRVAKP